MSEYVTMSMISTNGRHTVFEYKSILRTCNSEQGKALLAELESETVEKST